MSLRSNTPTQTALVAVVGFGNILMKDDGIGIHVIRKMINLPRESTRSYELVDGGTCPDVLIHLPNPISQLVVIDAVQGGGAPGSIYVFRPDDLVLGKRPVVSLHQLGFWDTLEIMKLLGKSPERISIIGIEPKKIDWGLKLSPELEKAIPHVIRVLEQEVGDLS